MGVDYSVVSGFGCEIEDVDRDRLDDLQIPLSKRGYAVIEAGSANYGGAKLLAFVALPKDAAVRDSAGWLVQPREAPPFDLAVAAEFGLKPKGDIGWLAGIHVW